MARRILTATTWEQTRRGGDTGVLAHWTSDMRAAAHASLNTSAAAYQWRPTHDYLVGARAAFARRAPRPRPAPIVPEPELAWTELMGRWRPLLGTVPERPGPVLTYLARQASVLELSTEDVLNAAVVEHQLWRGLDRIERILFASAEYWVESGDLRDAVGVDTNRGVAHRRQTVLAARSRSWGTRVSWTGPAVPERPLTPRENPLTAAVDPSLPKAILTEVSASELAEYLVEHRWQPEQADLESEPEHHVPAPEDLLGVAEHLAVRASMAALRMPVDVRLGEIRAGFRMVSYLRIRSRDQRLVWYRLCRERGLSWALLGAISGRGPEATAAHYADLCARRDTQLVEHGKPPQAMSTASAADDRWWAPETEAIHAALASLLTTDFNTAVEDADAADTVEALREAMVLAAGGAEVPIEEQPLTNAVARWLMTLITELHLGDVLDGDPERFEQFAPALDLRTRLRSLADR
jgi:hypothetical protein